MASATTLRGPACRFFASQKVDIPAGGSGKTPVRKTIQSIQFLRFVAALLVVFHHTNLSLIDQGLGRSFNLLGLTDLGQSGVHLFFVISGFIMVFTAASSAGNPQAVRIFLLRRLLRIYPVYWIYAALCFVLYAAVLSPLSFTLGQGLAALALLPGHSFRIITPGWTLTYEVYFYLCFGLSLLLPFRWGMTLLSAFFMASIVAGRLAGATSDPALHLLTNTLLLEFLFGAWVGAFLLYGRPLNGWWPGVLIILSVVSFSLSLIPGSEKIPSAIRWGVPSALIVAAFALSELQGKLPRWVSRWSFLGDSSYSLYLLHMLVIHLSLLTAVALGASANTGALVGLAAVIMSLCVGLVAYNWIEKPLQFVLLRMLRSRFSKAPPESAKNLALIPLEQPWPSTNLTGDNARKGAGKRRSQLKTKVMGEKRLTKRSNKSGEFIDQKVDGNAFKGVWKEKTARAQKKK